MTRQRMSIMNIPDLMRMRIMEQFPLISEEELQLRLTIAGKLIDKLR